MKAHDFFYINVICFTAHNIKHLFILILLKYYNLIIQNILIYTYLNIISV